MGDGCAVSMHSLGGELSLKISIPAAKVKKGFPYSKLLSLFHKKLVAKKQTDISDLVLLTDAGDPVDLRATVSGSQVSLVVKTFQQESTVVSPKETASYKKGKSAAAAYRTLTLVEPESQNDLGRTWYLKEGLLDSEATAWVLSQSRKCHEKSPRLKEMILAYYLGFALNRRHQQDEATKALAKAATTQAFATEAIDPLWGRKIFTEGGLARAGDRWNEVALYKLAVSRGIWKRWDQRPTDFYDTHLEASPLWPASDTTTLIIGQIIDENLLEQRLKPLLFSDSFPTHSLALPTTSDDTTPFLREASALASRLQDQSRRVRRVSLHVSSAGDHETTNCAPTNALLRYELQITDSTFCRRVADQLTTEKIQVYDPSFEHELWNDDKPRVAFVVDFLHPSLPDDHILSYSNNV